MTARYQASPGKHDLRCNSCTACCSGEPGEDPKRGRTGGKSCVVLRIADSGVHPYFYFTSHRGKYPRQREQSTSILGCIDIEPGLATTATATAHWEMSGNQLFLYVGEMTGPGRDETVCCVLRSFEAERLPIGKLTRAGRGVGEVAASRRAEGFPDRAISVVCGDSVSGWYTTALHRPP